MNIKNFIFFALLIVAGAGCSKEDDGNDVSKKTDLSGTFYYDWADEGIYAYDTETDTRSLFLPTHSKRNNWDLSRDRSILLTASKNDIWTDDITFVLSNAADGSIINQFNYTPIKGGTAFNSGVLSPDNTMIAIKPSFEEGFVILNTDGTLVTHIYDINGEKVERREMIQWLPDNSIIITHKDFIIKLAPPYDKGTLIKEMNYTNWGDLAVNQQGTKIALRIGTHIHMMNIDGSDLVQVTDSNEKEAYPVFSPDGKYLMIGTQYTPTGLLGAIWRLKAIPADGKTYFVDSFYENSPEVIPIMNPTRDKIESASGTMLWR